MAIALFSRVAQWRFGDCSSANDLLLLFWTTCQRPAQHTNVVNCNQS